MKNIIYLVDDDEAVRHALTIFLKGKGYEIKAFNSAESFLAVGIDSCQGVLVLDQRMENMSGLELQAELKRLNVSMPIIFITGHGDIQMSVMAMKAGAITFLEKPFSNHELLSAIKEAFDHLKDNNKFTVLKRDALAKYEKLTPREKIVMTLVAKGYTNKKVATTLDVSNRTVEVHRSKVMQKMEVNSLPELVRLADICSSKDTII